MGISTLYKKVDLTTKAAHIWVAWCRISAGGHLEFVRDFDTFRHFVETDGWGKDSTVHNIFDNPQRREEF